MAGITPLSGSGSAYQSMMGGFGGGDLTDQVNDTLEQQKKKLANTQQIQSASPMSASATMASAPASGIFGGLQR